MSGRLLLCRERWQSQTADHTHGCCWESGHPDPLQHRCQCGALLIVSYMHSPAQWAPYNDIGRQEERPYGVS